MDRAHRVRNILLLAAALTTLALARAEIPSSRSIESGSARGGDELVEQLRTVDPRQRPVYVLEWGSAGPGDDQFGSPVHLAAPPSGFVYVSDQGKDTVFKFDDDGGFLARVGGPGEAEEQFNNPWGLGVDSLGNLYVADSNQYRVQKFDSDGNFLVMWGYGVKTGSNTFETCTSGCQVGISGQGAGQLGVCVGLAVDSSNYIYVASYGTSRIVKYNSSGTYIMHWGSSGETEGEFKWGPESVAVDGDGFVYTSETANARVQVFDSSGNFVRMWGWGVDDSTAEFQVCTSGCLAGIRGSGDWQFDGPTAIAVDADNYVYVVDFLNDRVSKFDRQGNRLTQWNIGNGALDGPNGIAIQGSVLYLVDVRNYRIIKYMGPFLETYVGEASPETGR